MTRKTFDKDGQSFSLDNLTFETNVDRVAIYGSVNIDKDQTGLKKALELQQVINDLVSSLQQQPDLPEKIEQAVVRQVKNPFL